MARYVDKKKGRRLRNYMSDAEETRLPYGLGCVVAQVFIIINRYDGRKLLQCILRVFTEKDEWFFSRRNRTRPKSFSLTVNGY